jgi:hypothetical protein
MLPRLRAICRAPVSTLGAPCCSLSTTIDVSKLKVTKTSTPKPHVAKEKLLFGVTTTDHILEVDWDVDQVSVDAVAGAPCSWHRVLPAHPA